MKGNGGFVTDKEEMDGSDHGGHDKAQHNGSVDPQVEEMLLKIRVFWKNVTSPNKSSYFRVKLKRIKFHSILNQT